MIEKIKEALTDRCRDMGLSRKAITRLAEIGAEGISEDATDEDISAKVEMLVPFAKEMQAEVTRKTKKTQSAKQSDSEGDGEGEKMQEAMPEWAKSFQSELTALKQENENLKAEKLRSERQSQIAAKAKELDIPSYIVSRIAIPDDADIAKELESLRQDLVTNNLMPKGLAHEIGTNTEAMKADAIAWASRLPNN